MTNDKEQMTKENQQLLSSFVLRVSSFVIHMALPNPLTKEYVRRLQLWAKDRTMNDSPNEGFRQQPLWLLGVAGLVIAQAGLALALFGSTQAWSAVTDDRAVLSGRHPLHLYHGTLGAAAFRDHGTTTCYDPQFQA